MHKVFTPQDIAEMQGTSYNKALGDLQQSDWPPLVSLR